MIGLNVDDIGYQAITTSGTIGTAGKAVAVFAWAIKSGGTAGVAIFRNGSTSGGTEVFEDTGTANVMVTHSIGGKGVVFPSGLYMSIDGNCSLVTVFFRQVLI